MNETAIILGSVIGAGHLVVSLLFRWQYINLKNMNERLERRDEEESERLERLEEELRECQARRLDAGIRIAQLEASLMVLKESNLNRLRSGGDIGNSEPDG